MADKKKKPITQREKKERAEIRAMLRKDGLLPPVKKPLNRKKFCDEVNAQWEEHQVDIIDMITALQCMMPETKYAFNGITSEEIGALKVAKIAIEVHLLRAECAENGTSLTLGELFDKVIKPVKEL